jgi:hypothetical protein
MGLTERNSTTGKKKEKVHVRTYLHNLASAKSERSVLGFASPHLQNASDGVVCLVQYTIQYCKDS